MFDHMWISTGVEIEYEYCIGVRCRNRTYSIRSRHIEWLNATQKFAYNPYKYVLIFLLALSKI